MSAVAQPDGPTVATLDDFERHVRLFKAAGGEVRIPPHPARDRARWQDECSKTETALRLVYGGQPPRELGIGITLMCGAVDVARCLVAIAPIEVVGAGWYMVHPTEIYAGGLGTIRAVEGAGFALELALASEAVRRGLGVRGAYLPSSRPFHARIGRRLDQPARLDTIWTPDDCRYIVEGMEQRL